MMRIGLILAISAVAARADAQPSRPFGTEPAWPAGDISTVLAAPERPSQPPTPATPQAQAGARVRAPYRQAEQPAPADLEAARREQQARLRNPEGWRRGALASEQERRPEPTSRFRETPLGPAGDTHPDLPR